MPRRASQVDLLRSSAPALALLLPKSHDAMKILKIPQNRRRLADSHRFSLRRETSFRRVAKIDYTMFCGRRNVSFGSSRSCDFIFPPNCGVEAQHFILHLDYASATLVLTDTSSTGTWIYQDSSWHDTLLYGSSMPISAHMDIRLGHAKEIHFELKLGRALQNIRSLTLLGCSTDHKSSAPHNTSSPKVNGVEHTHDASDNAFPSWYAKCAESVSKAVSAVD